MENKIKEQEEYWTRQALGFDAFKHLMQQSWSPMIQAMDLGLASSILEVGAGRGYCSEAILSLIPPSATLLSTDLAPGMIEALKQKLVESERVKVQQANALDLNTVSDASLSHYIANMTIHLVPDVGLMLSECHRVLKEGGIAGFTFW
jgi:ubiquinone/menaquinone biosynthesis C-methylase UbiE